MRISLTDAGKRYNREWVFRHVNYTFQTGQSYAITGHNGSGKSTLLQVIAGSTALSEGKIGIEAEQPVKDELHYAHVSITAPYLEVVEEMTGSEFLAFHAHFRNFIPGFSIAGILDRIGLALAADKQIRYYSSGMKQRIKLAQGILTDCPFVLLDEPCTNLDEQGIQLYHALVNEHCAHRCVVVSSNDPVEYGFCKEKIEITRYK